MEQTENTITILTGKNAFKEGDYLRVLMVNDARIVVERIEAPTLVVPMAPRKLRTPEQIRSDREQIITYLQKNQTSSPGGITATEIASNLNFGGQQIQSDLRELHLKHQIIRTLITGRKVAKNSWRYSLPETTYSAGTLKVV